MGAGKATVFIVDDDPPFRRLADKLFGSVGLKVVPCASGAEFLAAQPGDGPACVVLDVRLPDMSGLEVLERLCDRGGSPPVIMVTGHADVAMAVESLKLGAVDFLEKPVRNQDLLDRVQEAISRHEDIRAKEGCLAELRRRFEALTPREKQVLERVVAGQANKVIAADLGLSMKTVEYHRSQVMHKVRADSLADLVRMAVLLSHHGYPGAEGI